MNQNVQYIPTYQDPEIYWSSFDLSISAYLVSTGLQIVYLNRDNPTKVLFVFKRNKKLEKLVERYYNDDLKVNPRLLFDSLNLLKNRIHSSN